MTDFIDSGAVVSEDTLYRYRLWRYWGKGPAMVWVMLNPSTADHVDDDPTIRRCMSFARREGCDGIEVINLFALRTTKPVHLLDHPDPEGPDNPRHWRMCLGSSPKLVVAGWGANARKVERVGIFSAALASAQPWHDWKCLGFTNEGAPIHPLYQRSDQELLPL